MEKRLRLFLCVILATLGMTQTAMAETVTAEWDWQNGKPSTITSVHIENGTGSVASTVEGIDLYVEATNSKLKSNGDNVAFNAGTILRVPVVSTKDVVTVKAHSYNFADIKIGGTTYTTQETNYTATAFDVTQGYVEVLSTNSPYLYSVKVVQNKDAASAGFKNFAVDLTNGNLLEASEKVQWSTVGPFGIAVGDNGAISRVASDAADAACVVSGKWHSDNYGWASLVITVKVDGPVKVTLGTNNASTNATIMNGSAEVATLNIAGNNWDATHTERVVSAFYKGSEATTLTINAGSYQNYFAIEVANPADLVDEATVSFSLGEAAGLAPASVKGEVGSKITLPKNFTMYIEGKTLTGWSDGTNTYAPGAEYTIPEADKELTPVFTANEVSLADRTEALTLNFDFQRNNGAPIVAWQDTNDHVWVTQATIGGKTIDVAMTIDTNPGKFNNTGNKDCTQTNSGTIFTIPSCKGATVETECHGSFTITTTTIDGQTDYTGSGTSHISYTIGGTDETVKMVIGDGSYYKYVNVTLPVVQQQSTVQERAILNTDFQDWTSSNTTSVIKTNFSKEDITFTYENTSIAPEATNESKFPTTTNAAFKGYIMCEKKDATVTTSVFNNITKIRYHHGATGSNRGWGLKVKAGDGDWEIVSSETTNGTAWIEKNINKENVQLQWYNLNTSQNAYMFELEIYANVEITTEQVTLATAVSPEGAGTATVYPASESYDKDTEVTLTATDNFGYDFVNWTNAAGEEVSKEAKFKYTVTSNETLTANFQQVETYELKLTVDGTNDYMVSVNPAPTIVDGKWMYETGTSVTLTANQYEGLVTFNNWSDNTTSSELTVTMDANKEITAVYSENDIIAGWDFYNKGNNGRPADFAAAENESDALSLVNTETGAIAGWLDKSTVAAGGYEGMKGAAVSWQDTPGTHHWQTKVNAEAFTDIKVQFQMLYNYNAYPTFNVEFSTNGTDWASAGSVVMSGAKAIASFNETLPATANNQKELYIRMIADKTSTIAGTAGKDGIALGMFFITGTPKLVDDPVPPTLVSSVPAHNSVGASASGKIVLTFDKKVKVAENATATLGELILTPIVSGKTVSFQYKGLDYATAYTFNLPANTVQNLTDATLAEAITISFTTMSRPSVTKGLYDAVVSTVEELSTAIAAANSRTDKTTRYRIFLKKGTYKLPTGKMKHYVHNDNGNLPIYWEGDLPDPITYITAANISFIGEDRDATIITQDITNDEDMLFTGKYGKAHKYEEIKNSAVLQLESTATSIYFQDVTIKSGINDNLGRNLAVYDKASKTIYNNVYLHGYQDTWTSDGGSSVYYFEDGIVRGRTDYLCGKGDAFFNGVELMQVGKDGYPIVPSNPAKIGWVFKDCSLSGETNDVTCTLGRPWGNGTPVAILIDTKMNVIPNAIGWSEMGTGWPKRFAEYNSMTSSGTQIDLSGRKKTFGEGHANNPVLTAEEAESYSDMSLMFGDWNPTLLTEQAPVPQNVQIAGNTLTWDDSIYALLFAVCKDDKITAFTTEATYTVDDATAKWTVRAANEMGGLSEASAQASTATGIKTVATQQRQINGAIYSLSGQRVSKASRGLYIINGKTVVVK